MTTSSESLRHRFRDAKRWMQAAAIKNLRSPMVLQQGEAGVMKIISRIVGSVFGDTLIRKIYAQECLNEVAHLLPSLSDSDRGVVFTIVGDRYDIDHRRPSEPRLDNGLINEIISKSGIIESVKAGRAPSRTRINYLVSSLSRVIEDSYMDSLDRTVTHQILDKDTPWIILNSYGKPRLERGKSASGLKKLRVLEPSACDWCRNKPSIMNPAAKMPRHKGCLCTTRLVRR